MAHVGPESVSRRSRFTPLRIALIAVALLAVLLLWFALSVIYAEPKIAIDYGRKMHESVRARQAMPPDANDGWLQIDTAIEKFNAARSQVAARHPSLPPEAFDPTFLANPAAVFKYEDFTRQQAESVSRELLEAFGAAGGWDELEAFAAIPYAARPPFDGPLVQASIPDLGPSRSIARLCAARLRLAAEAGEDAVMIAAFEQGTGLGRHLSGQATIIDHLVGMSIMALMQQELRMQILAGRVSAEAAEELLGVIDRQSPWPVAPVFEAERYVVLDTIQRCFSDNGRGNGHLLPTAASDLGGAAFGVTGVGLNKPPRVMNLAGLLHPDRRTTEARANEIFDGLAEYAAMTQTERKAATGPDIDTLVNGNRLLERLIPSGYTAIKSNCTIRADREATRLMLAIEVHRARTGTYPAALDALADLLGGTVPLDPVVDRAFGYRLLGTPDRHQRPYLLYSITTDGVDNDGEMGDRPPETPILRRSGLTNVDYVYNQPQAKLEPAAAESDGE